MTMTGIVMGTPRYMSPEQAAAAKQPVDHRTDIYSLGATLYELATGKPVFESDSPHGVITQILNSEPVRPRIVRRNIPRDLETIVMKCLAKERRRALSDGAMRWPTTCGRIARAAQSRPGGKASAERAVRWVRKRKKGAAVATIAAAATLLVAIGSYFALSSWAAARLSRLSVVTNPDDHFKVEVLDENEQKTIAAFTAPTQEAQIVPPGHYHVRLSRAGQLSETSQFEAGFGGNYTVTAALRPRNLWEMSLASDEAVEMARLDGRDDVLLACQDKLRRLNGATAQPIWEVSLAAKDQPLVDRALHSMQGSRPFFGPNVFGNLGAGYEPPCLVRPPVDLDGDGIPDLIWGSRTVAALAAVSGKSGKLLWYHKCRAALSGGLREEEIQSRQSSSNLPTGNVIGKPLLAEAGGKNIVVSVFAVYQQPNLVDNLSQLWLEAIDAATGATIWRRQLDYSQSFTERNILFVATTWKQDGRTVAAIVCANRLYGFDVLTGQATWPDQKLDAEAPLAAWFANLRGGSEPELVLLRQMAVDRNDSNVNNGFGPRGNRGAEADGPCATLRHTALGTAAKEC